MGDAVVVDTPISALAPPLKATPADAIPDIDPLEGWGNDDADEYTVLKRLQRHLEYVCAQSFGKGGALTRC